MVWELTGRIWISRQQSFAKIINEGTGAKKLGFSKFESYSPQILLSDFLLSIHTFLVLDMLLFWCNGYALHQLSPPRPKCFCSQCCLRRLILSSNSLDCHLFFWCSQFDQSCLNSQIVKSTYPFQLPFIFIQRFVWSWLDMQTSLHKFYHPYGMVST